MKPAPNLHLCTPVIVVQVLKHVSECRWFAPHCHLAQLLAYLLADVYVCGGLRLTVCLYTDDNTPSCPLLLDLVTVGIVISIFTAAVQIFRLRRVTGKLAAKIS